MFKFKNKKLLYLSAVAAIALPVSMATAASTNVDATAFFRAAITLTPTAMDFSNIDYSAAPTVVGDFVRLGTDSSINYGGVFSAGASPVPAAGTVAVATGTAGLTVDVSCDATAAMDDGAGNEITVNNIEVIDLANATTYGGGHACVNPATVSMSYVLGSATDTFAFGGQIDGSTVSGTFSGGAYSTATGGDDIQVDVVYQ